jgi:hypothetical protein
MKKKESKEKKKIDEIINFEKKTLEDHKLKLH